MEKSDIIIIGAGIVGVSTALELQKKGLSVTLIDKSGPAEGASYGNGGVLASLLGRAGHHARANQQSPWYVV